MSKYLENYMQTFMQRQEEWKMFDALKDVLSTNRIIGPNPDPWPFPKREPDLKDLLLLAVLYLVFLIFTRGVAAPTAFAMASKKYNVSEEALRKAAKEQAWL